MSKKEETQELINFFDSMFAMIRTSKYVEESNETFDYYIALPGLVREDIEIKAMMDKDFTSVVIYVKKESNFVNEKVMRIVKLKEEVSDKTEDILVDMQNGVLKVSFKKTNPITETIL